MRKLKCICDIPHSVQLASLVLWPIKITAEDLLKELDGKIYLPQLSLKSKELLKLFLFTLAWTHSYKSKGASCPFVLLLPRCITDPRFGHQVRHDFHFL